MELNELSAIQQEIFKALDQMKEKQMISEAVLSKRIRENAKIEGKNKAVIGFKDLEKVFEFMESNGCESVALHLNSANDILIKKEGEFKTLDVDAKKRRLSSEKSMTIFTNADINSKKNSGDKKKHKSRTERKSMNIYADEDEWEI